MSDTEVRYGSKEHRVWMREALTALDVCDEASETRYGSKEHRVWMREALTALDEEALRRVLSLVLSDTFAAEHGLECGVQMLYARLFGRISVMYEGTMRRIWEDDAQGEPSAKEHNQEEHHAPVLGAE